LPHFFLITPLSPNDSFIAVAVHFIDPKECVLKTFLLGCHYIVETHTAVNLSLFSNNCFKEWNINITATIGI